jgi:hypothetical protein
LGILILRYQFLCRPLLDVAEDAEDKLGPAVLLNDQADDQAVIAAQAV